MKVVRDWASIEGGAKVGKFTPPDYGPFGCGPEQLLDLNLGTGWGSDAVGSTVGQQRRRARARSSSSCRRPSTSRRFAVASNGACGDGPEAGVKKFKVETKTAGGKWITAFVGTAQSNGKLLKRTCRTTGKANVRFVRFTMLSNHGDPLFMDVMEFSVRGK